MLTKFGNFLEGGADLFGTASTALETAGAVVTLAGVVAGPEAAPVTGAGVGMMVSGGGAGLLASVMQVAGVLVSIALVLGMFEKAHGADPMLADVRCVVVEMHMSTLNIPQQRDAGTVLSIYYFGRLDGRSVLADVEQLIEKEAGKMTPEDLRTEAVRCGKALSNKGQEIARITAALAGKWETSAITK